MMRIAEHYSSDRDVQRFIEAMMRDDNPYRVRPMTVREIFDAAREQFGDFRCMYAGIWLH